MPIRRINFTDRRRIVRDDIEIVLRKQLTETAFDARLDLASYEFPPDARVFIEAYRQTTVARFDFGTVSVPQLPPDRSLAAFDLPVEMMFRVRVTAVSGRAGILLGEADRIRPREAANTPDRRTALLPPVPGDLGEELWRVDFSNSTTYLVINNQLPDWKTTAQDPVFRAFVFPAAMREILERVLFIERVTTTEDSEDWRSLWLRFATGLPGSRPVPGDEEKYEDWIDDAVAAFARKGRFLEIYNGIEQE